MGVIVNIHTNSCQVLTNQVGLSSALQMVGCNDSSQVLRGEVLQSSLLFPEAEAVPSDRQSTVSYNLVCAYKRLHTFAAGRRQIAVNFPADAC